VINGGLLLNVLLRGRWFCYLAGPDRRYPTTTIIGKKCFVSCMWESDGVIVAVCSAVAELPPHTVMDLSLNGIHRGRWLWVVYMLCCGSSMLNIDNFELIGESLTRAGIAAVRLMMKNRYPVVESETNFIRDPVYGFASIPEGAELWPLSVAGGDANVLVSTLPIRCRARYFPTSTPDWVEAVVPGYGICKTRVGHGASCFDRDPFELDTQPFRECRLRSLYLYMDEMEWDALVLELLRYVGGGLLTLSIAIDRANSFEFYDPLLSDLDLSELAVVCPHLEVLELDGFDVVLRPSNDDALRDWPIKKTLAAGTDRFPDLAPYLENLEMRMARELVDISIEAGGHEDFDEEKTKSLEGNNGEYLPLVKAKFPLQSKMGMLSVVASSSSSHRSVLETKAINELDANVLSRIFTFAATPERRTVRCPTW
jgi:hypothetical protein